MILVNFLKRTIKGMFSFIIPLLALIVLYIPGANASAVERKELKVLTPECEDKIPSGSQKLITWSGVAAADSVNILLSVDGGRTWDTLAKSATGFTYLAQMPDVESDSCYVRISSTKTVSGSFKLRHNGEINAAAFSGNGAYIATFGSDSVASVWDAATGDLLKQIPRQKGKLIAGAIDFSGSYIATVSSDSSVVIWNAKSGKEQMTPKLNFRPLCVNFSSDGRYLLVGGINGIINIYVAPFFAFLKQLRPNPEIPVWDARFMPGDERILFTAAGFAEVYDWNKSESIIKYDTRNGEPYGDIRQVSCNSDGTLIAAASLTSKKAFIFFEGIEQPAGEFSHLDTTLKTILTTDFYRDPSFGEVLLTGGVDKRAKLSIVSTGAPLAEFMAHTNTVTTAKFHPNGDRILTASLDSTAIIWKGNLDIIADGVMACPFSLTRQRLDITALDFDTVAVTSRAWRAPAGYIKNNSQLAVKIESVETTPGSPFAVALTKDLPVTLEPGDSVGAYASFTPLYGDSLYEASAIVHTEFSIFNGKLTGYGKEYGLVAEPKEIDFETTETGAFRDTLLRSILFNRSSKDIAINSATIAGQATSEFMLINSIDGLSMKPGDSLDLSFRFAPTTDAPASAYLRIGHTGKGDTLVRLSGTAITVIPDSLIVTCKKFVAGAGRLINSPITVSYPNYSGSSVELETEWAFNSSMLLPIGEFTDVEFSDSIRIIKLKQTVNSASAAFPIDFKALLGNDTITAISLRSIKATGEGRYKTAAVDGEFVLEGYCEKGGLRLFDPFAETRILSSISSPLSKAIEIKFETRGAGEATLELYAGDGSLSLQIIGGFLSKGVHSVTLQPEQIAPGFYLLTLRSGTDVVVRKLIISR